MELERPYAAAVIPIAAADSAPTPEGSFGAPLKASLMVFIFTVVDCLTSVDLNRSTDTVDCQCSRYSLYIRDEFESWTFFWHYSVFSSSADSITMYVELFGFSHSDFPRIPDCHFSLSGAFDEPADL